MWTHNLLKPNNLLKVQIPQTQPNYWIKKKKKIKKKNVGNG